MKRGRKPDLDKRIARLISELKAAILERERLRIDAEVDAMAASLAAGSRSATAPFRTMSAEIETESLPPARRKRTRSAASRAAQGERMKEYWRKRKAAAAKGNGKRKAAEIAAPVETAAT